MGKKCIAHCPIKEEPQRKLFGDQRYVEDWPDKYKKVHILESIGANAALWNITNYKVTRKGGQILLDNVPLIFYHFSGLSIISRYEFNLCWYYHIQDEKVVSQIYHPYLERLSAAIGGMQKYFPGSNGDSRIARPCRIRIFMYWMHEVGEESLTSNLQNSMLCYMRYILKQQMRCCL